MSKKDWEKKNPWRLEGFLEFMNEELVKKDNGAWEDTLDDRYLKDDLEYSIMQVIMRDIVFGSNREIAAIITGSFDKPLKEKLKEAYRDNISGRILEEDKHIYEVFANMSAMECMKHEDLKNKVESFYADRYAEEHAMVGTLEETYKNKQNDDNAICNILYEIFARATNWDTDPNEIRVWAIYLFMIEASIRCGHVLPYRKIYPPIWGWEKEPGEDRSLDSYTFITMTYDKINGFYTPPHDMPAAKVMPAPEEVGIPGARAAKGYFSNRDLEKSVSYQDLTRQRNQLHKKYIRERIKLLAGYLGCDFNKEDMRGTMLEIAATLWDKGYNDASWKMEGYCSIADNSSYNDDYAMDSFKRSKEEDKDYYINLLATELIWSHFTTKLEALIMREIAKDKGHVFTRHEIIRELGTDDIAQDAEFLINLSYIAAAFKGLNKTQELYIDNFDMFGEENITAARFKSLYRDEVKKKDRKIEDQKQEIESLKNIVNTLSKSTETKESKTDKKLVSEIKKLESIIEKKNAEVDEAEKKTADLLEYIEMIEAGDIDETDAEVGITVNMDALKQRRFAFVCNDIDNLFPELRKDFPGSVFFDRITNNPQRCNVDAVVFMTKFMSHSLYYKAKILYSGTKMINFNQKNLEALYRQIAKELNIA